MAALDFGGDPQSSWEIHGGWDHGVHAAAAGTPQGQADKNGVYQPETPEAQAALGFPNISAGVAGEVKPKGNITPTVQVEAFRFKVPELRWWEVQVGAGDNMAEIYLGKRLVSVFEITAGPWAGWDFTNSHLEGPNFLRKVAYGVMFTLIKF